MLFIGFVFLIQSGLLTALVTNRNRALLSYDKYSSEELIVQYVNMHNEGGLKKLVFDNGPISIPIPVLREKIEYKIIQEFFVRNYNLPAEFKFANYMCKVLRHYVLSLVEVRPISWILLAGFVALNVIRIEVIDQEYARSVCEEYPAKHLHRGAHRYLSGVFGYPSSYAGPSGDDTSNAAADAAYGQHVCQEYLLRYTFICLMCIVLYLVGVLTASEIYIQRLIDKVLDQEETIQWLEEEEQRQQQLAVDNEFVDIAQLPDDTPPALAGNSSAGTPMAGSNNKKSEPGIELTNIYNPSEEVHGSGNPAAQSNGTSKPPLQRLPSGGRARSGSAGCADDPDTPPPKPVHGANAVRRLSINHRVGSAKANELAAMIAAGNAHSTESAATTSQSNAAQGNGTNPHTPSAGSTVPAATPGPRRMNANYRTSSLRSDGGDGAARALGPRMGSLKGEQLTLKLDMDSPNGPVVRRLASNQRMGSLHSEDGDGAGNAAGLAPRKRLNSAFRVGSLRSEVSEISGKQAQQKASLVSHNRRFLYLRCLERIMHVEFDFHANEAKRMGLAEGGVPADSTKSSLPQTPRVKSFHHGGGSVRDMLHSPHERRSEKLQTGLTRTNSVASMVEGSDVPSQSYDPNLVHTDMRSNFLLMKSLREEMLQQESLALAAINASNSSHNPHTSLFRGQLAFPKAFFSAAPTLGSLSGHGYAPAINTEPTGSNAPTRPPSVVDIEQGPMEPAPRPSTADAILLDYRRSSEGSVDGDRASVDDEHHEPHGGSGKRRGGRGRTFSLAFEAPPLQGQHLPKEATRQKKLTFGNGLKRVFAFFKTVGSKAVSALLGHHIGEAEAHVDADIADMQKDFSQVFLFQNAELYYFSVEFSLLAQCVYLALWATNFVFIANDSYFPVLWHIALLFPVPFNFLVTKQIIFTSVMLKSIVTLDKRVADQICEDAADERNVKHRLRKVIRTALRTMEVPREKWHDFARDQFDMFLPVDGDDDGLDEAHMRLFLHSMQIFLTDATVKKVFSVIDFNGDGTLSWDEISPIVFPELVKKHVKINKNKTAPTEGDSSTSGVTFSIEGDLTENSEKKRKEREERKKKRASLLAVFDGDNSSSSLADLASAAGTGGDENHKRSADGVSAVGAEEGQNGQQKVKFSKSKSKTAAFPRPPQDSTDASAQKTGSKAASKTTPKKARISETHRQGVAIGESIAPEELVDINSDDSERGDVSSESSFNSHSVDSIDDNDENNEDVLRKAGFLPGSDSESEVDHTSASRKSAVQPPPPPTEESKMELAAAQAQAAHYRYSGYYDV